MDLNMKVTSERVINMNIKLNKLIDGSKFQGQWERLDSSC